MSDFSETETARDERQAGSRTSLAGVLSVDGTAVEAEHSTGHDSGTFPGLRGHADLRSPGVNKTPLAVNELGNDHATGDHHFVPDFITQTDRYGRATTSQSAAGYCAPRQKEDVEMDAYDSFLDGFRSLCCCLASEDDGSTTGVAEAGGPVAYSTRGPDAPLLLEEDSALRNGANPQKIKLLGGLHNEDQGKKCLVLDLDETLVHSSFREVPGADFVIPVQIDDVVHYVYVAKRPNVDEFLMEMAKHYEIVVYTASLNKYADPLLDLLDPNRVIRTRLFRESCVFYAGNFVKDLSLLNRDLSQAIIVDNSPASYLFHPENAIDCTSFINDPNDRELNQIGKFLIGIKHVEDVRGVVIFWRQWPNIDLLRMKADKLSDPGNMDPGAGVH